MHVEVDQSGKVGNSQQDVVLALVGEGASYTVLIPARVQRAFLQEMRGRVSKKTYTQLFAVALYFLLREHLDQIDMALIDMEYPGQDAMIKEHLFNLFKRAGIHVRRGQVQFGYVTKKSPAHKLALETYRGDRPADLVLTLAAILDEF